MLFRLTLDPTREEEIAAVVHERTALIDEIERLVQQANMPDRLPGYAEEEIVMLPLGDIECFFTEGEKLIALCTDGGRYRIRRRLGELADLLPGQFVRIHKSAIANWTKVSHLKVHLSGAVDAVFQSGHTECISRRCFAELKRRYEL